MAGFGMGTSMRKPVEQSDMLSRLESGQPLPDDDPRTRNGGLNPSRQKDIPQIQFYAQARQSGAISDRAWNRLIQRNPNAATLFSAVGVNPEVSRQRQTQNILGQYFSPEMPGNPALSPGEGLPAFNLTAGGKNINPDIAPQAAKADYANAINRALQVGNIELADKLKKISESKEQPYILKPGDIRFGTDNKPVAQGGPDPARADKLFGNAEKLRDNFNSLTKDFRAVNDSYERIKSSASEPSAAGDLSLIFNYMKMLDPGSVVRESEFATAAATGSFGERIQGLVERATNGQRLAPEVRQDFVDRSNMLFGAMNRNYEQIRSQYGEIAVRSGINPKDVITDFRAPTLKNSKPKEAPKDNKKDDEYDRLKRKYLGGR